MRLRLAVGTGCLSLIASMAAQSQEDLGKQVFTQIAQPSCALCHALQAAGSTGKVGPSLDELKPDKARVLEVVRNGVGVMPRFDDKLTPQQIDAVADYVARAVK